MAIAVILLPCPFCGSEPEIVDFGAIAFVRCSGCRCRGRAVQASVDYTAKEVAAKEWNQRVNELPKAHWEKHEYIGVIVCEMCRKSYPDVEHHWNYCPNCGAKIEEVEECERDQN